MKLGSDSRLKELEEAFQIDGPEPKLRKVSDLFTETFNETDKDVNNIDRRLNMIQRTPES